MAVVVIANPAAGYHQPQWREPVVRILSALGSVEVVEPRTPQETTQAARNAEARGASLVVAAGGDGTVHRVVNGLRTLDTHLGILPVGTGNDLAFHLGIPANVEDAAASMLLDTHRDIDLIRINNRRVFTSGVFCAIAEAAAVANRMKARWPFLGSFVYRLASAQVIALRGNDPVAGMFVVNIPRLGGNLRLPSGSLVDDGLCEIATLHGGRVRLTRTLLALSMNRPLPPGELTWERVSETTLTFDSDVMAFGDGEDLGAGRTFHIAMEPAALRVRCPRTFASEGQFAVVDAPASAAVVASGLQPARRTTSAPRPTLQS